MKVLAATFATLVVFASSVTTATAATPAPETEAPAVDDEGESRRGCCSHHGGVCGCGGETLRCCDGTDSPSCGC